MLLGAFAKTGIEAAIDEATGYQYDRASDALQTKLKMFLEEEMRPWEKTFPDELWVQFGRLTRWRGVLHQRPKYWASWSTSWPIATSTPMFTNGCERMHRSRDMAATITHGSVRGTAFAE